MSTLFAAILVILLGTAGLALDYGRALAVRMTMQSDLDAAMLAAAAAVASQGEANVAEVATRFLSANWRERHGVDIPSVAVNALGDGKLAGSATTHLPATVMRLFGIDQLDVTVTSEVMAGSSDAEVVLVVDTTGSMSGAKLDALKSAAKSLVEIIYRPARARDHVKVGLVPFAQHVNVGMAYRNAPWMSVPPDKIESGETCGDVTPLISQTNCRMVTATGYNDGVPYTYEYQECDNVYGPPVYQCTPYSYAVTWAGCVGSRNYPLDVTDDQYSTPVPGLQNVNCPSELTPLTNDDAAIVTQIDSMVATGETYVPAGVMWGWTLLSSIEPFAQAVPYGTKINGSKVRKIMVLMTDGANTISPNYPTHYGSDAVLANQLTREVCANVKASGIDVFTVAFEVTDATIKDILRECATEQFFDAANSSDLNRAFETIATQISALRVSR